MPRARRAPAVTSASHSIVCTGPLTSEMPWPGRSSVTTRTGFCRAGDEILPHEHGFEVAVQQHDTAVAPLRITQTCTAVSPAMMNFRSLSFCFSCRFLSGGSRGASGAAPRSVAGGASACKTSCGPPANLLRGFAPENCGARFGGGPPSHGVSCRKPVRRRPPRWGYAPRVSMRPSKALRAGPVRRMAV